MPPPNPAPGTPQSWIARAEGKLALAKAPLPSGGFLEDLCFFAQQTAELAIKAVYQQHGWLFPFTHDLARLIKGMRDNGLNVPPDVQEAHQISLYAAQARYPDLVLPVSQADYDDAMRIAEAVLAWAKTFIP